MATINELVSDIELRLSGGSISDDFTIDRRQIRFWLDQVRAALIAAKNKEDEETSTVWDGFLSVHECLVFQSKETCDDGCDDIEWEVNLPVKIMSLKNDMGVYDVTTQAGRKIKRVRLTELSRMSSTKFSRPNQENIVWYRLKDKLRFKGGTTNYFKNGKVNLYLIASNTDSFSDEDDFPIESELIPTLLDKAEEIGRRMLMIPEDKANDGAKQTILEANGK